MLDTTGKRAVARDRRGFLKLVTGAGLVAASGLAMNPTRAFADLPPLPGLRPEPPADFKPSLFERIGLTKFFSPVARMALRNTLALC